MQIKNELKTINNKIAALIISGATLASYLMGLIRDKIFSHNFGLSSDTDAYNSAFNITDTLFNLFIPGLLTAAFLPVFTSLLNSDREQAKKLGSAMLSAASTLIIVLATITFIFTPQIVNFMFGSASSAMQNDITTMTRLILPTAIIFTVSNTLGNVLLSYKLFWGYALSPVFYNLGIILGILILENQFGIYSAAIGVICGSLLHLSIRLWEMRHTDFKFKPNFQIRTPEFKKIIKLMIPRTFSLAAWQINLYLFTAIGLTLTEGGISAFNSARNIQSFAVSLFGVALATAIFPTLAENVTKKNYQNFTHQIQQTAQRTLFFTIPAAFGVTLLANQIVNLLLGGGEFGLPAVIITGKILFFFALSIPMESLVHLLSRAFYALHDTKTPNRISLICYLLIAISTIYIAPKWGIEMFSISFSVAMTLQVLLLATSLKKHLQQFEKTAFLKSVGKTLIACLIMTLTIKSLSILGDTVNYKLLTAIQIILGAGAFFISAYILKSEELDGLKVIFAKFKRAK